MSRAARLLRAWRTPFLALLTVPAATAIGIAALSFPALWADSVWGNAAWVPDLSADSARAVLTLVATGAMTALSLTYSLTLVVFTLATSNIGPRLLKRFTAERVNQVTAGILGGTFLYGAFVIGFGSDERPVIPALLAVLLAVVSVVQLVYFVRHVAQSVSVDDEIAQIVDRLRSSLTDLRDRVRPDADLPAAEGFVPVVCAPASGYVSLGAARAFCDAAVRSGLVLRVERQAGSYVLEGEPILSASPRPRGKEAEDLAARLEGLAGVEPARSDPQTVQYSIDLLVEIGLRALSPGVNDTFTALAVVDMLSGALAPMARAEDGPAVLRGEDGAVRVILPGSDFVELMGRAYHPLRRAAGANILMSQGLARAISRLHAVGNDEARRVVAKHARLLVAGLRAQGHAEEDLASVVERLSDGLRAAAAEPSADQDAGELHARPGRDAGQDRAPGRIDGHLLP